MNRRSLFPCLLFALAAATLAGAAPGDPPAPRPASVRDSPGYVPLVDPESTAVRLGRRPGAPLVRLPFEHGAASLADLGRAVCRAFERGTRDSLHRLTVTADEFRVILWPEFPQSRPATGLGWEDGWRVLDARLLNGSASAWQAHGGGLYEFVAIETNETVPYRNFTLHNGVTIVARNAAGNLERFEWIRSVAERKGRFKIYSMRD